MGDYTVYRVPKTFGLHLVDEFFADKEQVTEERFISEEQALEYISILPPGYYLIRENSDIRANLIVKKDKSGNVKQKRVRPDKAPTTNILSFRWPRGQ